MPIDEQVVDSVIAVAQTGAVETLVVDDLRPVDLLGLDWAGGAVHVRHVVEALQRVGSGDVEYLVVRAPSGDPIAKGGLDFAKCEDAGVLWQLATHPALHGLGIGSHLIREAERRILRRGRVWAELAVDDNNPRARSLYERLGFACFGQEQTSWEQEDQDGRPVIYKTTVTLLRKRLESRSAR